MITKEIIKKEIDGLPDNLLNQVHQFINSMKPKDINRKNIHSFKLKGMFDNVNIRQKAYE